MEFHVLLFFFFLNIHTIYQLIYQRLFYSKPLFYSKTSFLFLCKVTLFMSLYYSSLRVLCAFKFFFLFLYFIQISNMDDNTNYQEDYKEDLLSDIFPLREQMSSQKNLTFGIIMKHMV